MGPGGNVLYYMGLAMATIIIAMCFVVPVKIAFGQWPERNKTEEQE